MEGTRTLGNWAQKKTKKLQASFFQQGLKFTEKNCPIYQNTGKKDLGPVTEMVMSKSKSVNQESRIGLSGKSETGFSFFCRLGYYIEHIGKSSQKKKKSQHRWKFILS